MQPPLNQRGLLSTGSQTQMEAQQNRSKRTADQTQMPPSPPPLTLRPFNSSDSDIIALISLAADDRINRFLRRAPFADREDAVRFLHARILPHRWYRAICLSDGVPVGSISLRPKDCGCNETRIVSIAYRVAVACWGQGIATEAVRKATKAAFEEWVELERVEAMADAENSASQRVLEKAGFVREAVLRRYLVLKGEIRDMVMYSFVSADRVDG